MVAVVHVGTTFHTTFGVLDNEGNVVLKEVLEGEIDRLTPPSFMEALQAALTKRGEIENKINARMRRQTPSPPPGNSEPTDSAKSAAITNERAED